MRKIQNQPKQPFPQQDVLTKVVPAPTEGWDAISPLAAMAPNRAPILVNWTPRPGWVELRAGYAPTNLLGSVPVETLMVRRTVGSNAIDTQKMFAAMDGKIFDVSSLGGNTAVVTGLSSDRWQYVNFTPSLGTTVIQLVNGVDSLQQYDGSSWTTPSITGLPGGLGTNSISNIYAQKRRLWYLLNNGSSKGTTVAAFMPTDAISGAIAGTLDLGALWTRGGYLVSMADWTIDGGAGPNDYAAFVSSQGQVAIYQGTDPTSVNTWSLIGVFDLPLPIGTRCTTKIGSDVALITHQGVIPLSTALPFDPSADRSVAITSRIQNAMTTSAMNYGNNFGWQVITFPLQTLLVVNVPLTENAQQQQYVMNTLTGAWTQFTGWNANCWEIYNDNLYFGDNTGNVNQAYTGGSDLLNSISADLQCAFNYFDDPGRTKRITMIQPLLTASGTITPTLSVDADFGTSTSAAPVSIIAGGAQWDVSQWDVATWPGETVSVINWLSASGLGHALAIHMKVNVAGTSGTLTLGEFDLSVFDTATFDGSLPGTAPLLRVNAFNTVMEFGGFI